MEQQKIQYAKRKNLKKMINFDYTTKKDIKEDNTN